MKRRIFAGFLALALMLSVIPATHVHAQTAPGNSAEQETVDLSQVPMTMSLEGDAEAKTGTITPGYTSANGLWGEATANATESFVIKAYSGEKLLATTSLNNINGIIDGDVYVTWQMYAGSKSSQYWTTVWEQDARDWQVIPSRVELYADGTKVAENVVQLNAPDNVNPIEWWQVDGVEGAPVVVTSEDGTTKCGTLTEAIAAANDMTGESVTIGISGKAEYTAQTESLNGSYTTINFVGLTEDAEISITRNGSNGYISGENGTKTVNFTDLILSKPVGAYANDAGFMNVYFTVYRVANVSYTNCTFPDGACAAGCETNYSNCEFANKTAGEYSLWVYDNAECTVTSSEFTGVRGAKMYEEGEEALGNSLKIENSTFTGVTEKPAIVLTYGESVNLSGNTYPSTGVFELDADGAPNGTTVTADITDIACENDDYADCGVLVDGKIYTTITDAAAVAQSGSKVTLFYSAAENVELAEGVTLDKNGYTADNITGAGGVLKEIINLDNVAATIGASGEYTVSGNGSNNLTVKSDATIVLDGVNIEAEAGQSAISIESGNVTLIVKGDVNLTGGDNGAGIYVAEGASVTIKEAEGTESNKLTAIGNAGVDDASGAAGIGGTYANGNSGTITIDGTTVVAKGYGAHGSGIGSGFGGVSGAINIINGANVTAQGGYYSEGGKLQTSYGSGDPEGSAAIGGGAKTNDTIEPITISGSTVTAYGGSKAAGIGAAFWASCELIDIDNSTIIAYGGSSSAGIGTSRAGSNGVSANIDITNSNVTATGGDYGSGIGGGYNGDSLSNLPETTINISGTSEIVATGVNGGAGIGGGYKTNNLNIDISDTAKVTAAASLLDDGSNKTLAQKCASAIGSGANGSGTFVGSDISIAETTTITAVTYTGGKEAVETTSTTQGETNIIPETAVTEIVCVARNDATGQGSVSLNDALAAVTDGETTTLFGEIKLTGDLTITAATPIVLENAVLDLNGYTLTLHSTTAKGEKCVYTETGSATIKNGKIVVTADEDAHIDTGYFNVGGNTVLTLDNVELSGTNYRSNYLVDVGHRSETGATLKVLNSTIDLDTNTWVENGVVNGSIFYCGSNDNDVVIENSTITGKNVGDMAIYGDFTIVNSTIKVIGTTENGVSGMDHGFNGSNMVVTDSDITLTGGSGRGITLGRNESSSLTVDGTSNIIISDMGEATIKLSQSTDTITIADTSTVTVDEAITNVNGGKVEGAIQVNEEICIHDLYTKETVGAKAATCTAEGYTGDIVCSECKSILEKGTAIAALDHIFENGVCKYGCGTKVPSSSSSEKSIASIVETGKTISTGPVDESIIAEGKKELESLIRDSYGRHKLAVAVDLQGELTGKTKIKILVDDADGNDAVIILQKTENGWKPVTATAGDGYVIGNFSSLSEILIFVDENGVAEAAQAAAKAPFAGTTTPAPTGDNANIIGLCLTMLACAAAIVLFARKRVNK